MGSSKKYEDIGAIVGIVAGMLVWVVIMGFAIKVPMVSIVAAALGAVIILIALKLFLAYPQKRMSIFGAVVLLVISVDLFFINNFYEKIPYSVYGMTTGKECSNLYSLNVLLIAFGVAGLAMIVFDNLKKKQ